MKEQTKIIPNRRRFFKPVSFFYFGLAHIARKLKNKFLKITGPSANILFYHRVADVKQDPHLLCVTLGNFRAQMEFLKKRYSIISLKEMVGKIKDKSLSGGYVAITFDDGYSDNLYNALPILEELNIPATVFITAGKVGQDSPFEWDFDTAEQDRGRPLSFDELRVLASNHLIEIGSHTVTHPILSYKTKAEQHYEIIESKRILDDFLKDQITGFSYPVGSKKTYNHETLSFVKQANYKYACTTMGERVTENSDLFVLPRKLVRNWGVEKLISEIEDTILGNGVHIFLKGIINILKKWPFLRKNRFFMRRFLKNKMLYLLSFNKKPISDVYGMDRGGAVDRYYIEKFLENNAGLIKGNCLEVLDNNYTLRFGGKKIFRSDVLDIDEKNPNANIHDDLKTLRTIPDNYYDCIILTQVLQFVDDFEASIKQCRRALKPGGALLVTLPSISRIDCVAGLTGDYWRFTEASANYIFSKEFSKHNLQVNSYGNVLTGLAFWVGFALEEVPKRKLKYDDSNFPCIITVRAIK